MLEQHRVDFANEDEADSVTLSGQVEVGSTVNSTMISDGNPSERRNGTSGSDHGGPETCPVTVTGQDLSGYIDGTLTGDHEHDR
ncbi:hypothetical protein BCU64_025695 [Vibrio lentus]